MSSSAVASKPPTSVPKSAPGNRRVPARLQRTRKPEHMSLEEWQIALRRQFAQFQKFKIENLGDDPVHSQFRVTNPASGGAYVVTIRGSRPADNHCT